MTAGINEIKKMRMPRQRLWIAVLMVITAFSAPLPAEEKKGSKSSPEAAQVQFKIHTVYGSNGIFGPGAGTNASDDLDMSLFERDLGLKSQQLNGSGIVRNGNFPMVPGNALTSNNDLNVITRLGQGFTFSASLQTYTINGDPVVARVFGEELPFDSFIRDSRGRLAPTSSVTLFHTTLQQKEGPFQYSLRWGTFQPEISSKEFNDIKLGHVVYRPPITNESYFEKEDRKLEIGRHPLFGAQFLGDLESSGFLKSVHWEFFNGKSLPVPVNDGIHRTTNGGRAGFNFENFNLGLSYFDTFGNRLPGISSEQQTTTAVDIGIPVSRWLSLYGLTSSTGYQRSGGTSVHGNATVIGVRTKLLDNLKFKLQYQNLDKTYELAGGQHKVETYPGNYQGLMGELDWAVKGSRITFLFYRLGQKEVTLAPGETAFAFGDPYFLNLPNSQPGKVGSFRLYGEHFFSGEQWKLLGYVEYVNAFKIDGNPANNVDQTNQNAVLYLRHYFNKDLSLDFGYRRVRTWGNFQDHSFNSVASIPKIGFTWTPGKQTRFSILYNLYNFNDNNPVSLGLNNFQNNQLITEVFVQF